MTTTRVDASQVLIARAIATIAHRGQTDKLGAAYIDHPRRVAERLSDPLEQAVAWLHDVVEDTDISADDLLAAGLLPEVVGPVALLTRRDDVPSDDYYRAIRADATARAVKLADVADNTAGWRVERLAPEERERLAKKYENAKRLLGAEEESR
jgi:(p)ppGpp synthase/HD superfamily hydrolase